MGDISKGWPTHSISGHRNIQSNLHNFSAVLWILIGFNTDSDPDPALHLNADPDPGSQTNADLCGSGSKSWSHEKSQKFEFFSSKIYTELGNRSQNSFPTEVRKNFERKETRFICGSCGPWTYLYCISGLILYTLKMWTLDLPVLHLLANTPEDVDPGPTCIASPG